MTRATIIVPLDGSALAERALPYAETLSRISGGPIFLVRATEAHSFPGTDPTDEQVKVVEAAEAYLAGVAARLRERGLTVDSGVVYGTAGPAVLNEIKLRHADLAIMATHGRSGVERWLYGSVADYVLHRAEVPILLIPAAGARAWDDGGGTVLVPLDGSPLAEEALPPAQALATRLGAQLTVLRVVEPPNYTAYGEGAQYIVFEPEQELAAARLYLDAVAERLRQAGQVCNVRVIAGGAVPTIAAVAAEPAVMAVAMATHGRGGVARFVLGSVATGAIQRAQTPLLLVRPTAVSEQPVAASPEELSRVLDFSRGELDLLERAVDELIYHEGADGDSQLLARQLRGRLQEAAQQLDQGPAGPAAAQR